MKRVGLLNGFFLLVALLLGAVVSEAARRGVIGVRGGLAGIASTPLPRPDPSDAAPTGGVGTSTAAPSIRDSLGHDVPVQRYARIISASAISDQVLLELVSPARIAAFTARSQRQGPDAWRYLGRPGLEADGDLEAILSLRPDLLVVSGFADPRRVETLRASGVQVFDLGPMHGWPTLRQNIRDIARLVGEDARGDALIRRFRTSLQAVAADIPMRDRVEGLYVGVHGGRIYGGTSGTSYADTLRFGGVIDVAARQGLEGWPAYTAEQLLAIDPPFIITQAGREESLCTTAGLDRLRACREGHVRGVDAVIFTDPGLSMLRAAQAIRREVYGPVESQAAP